MIQGWHQGQVLRVPSFPALASCPPHGEVSPSVSCGSVLSPLGVCEKVPFTSNRWALGSVAIGAETT